MLPQLQAERQLAAIEAVSVPHMTDSSRRELVGRLGRRASPQTARTQSLAQALGAGARVIEVPKKVKR